MAFTLAFDVYGTLINTHGVVTALQDMVGERAQLFSQTWRDKQLEYTFRRGLMGQYEHFGICTAQALDYTCAHLNEQLTDTQKQQLMANYSTLPAFDDVHAGLLELQKAGHRLFAFSNGVPDGIEAVLKNAGIRDLFDGVVSVDPIRSFKPNPVVYQHFLDSTGSNSDSAWLVSSNPFDVIGAVTVGMRAAWVQRSSASIYDPWGVPPTFTIEGLQALPQQLELQK